MEKKNKLSAIFGEGWCLVAAIAAILVFISEAVTKLLQIIHLSGISYVGKANTFIQMIGIILAIPMLLIGIGLLLMYISGVKGQLHPAGITMVKVSVMIRGIVNFAGIVIVEAVLLVSTIFIFAAKLPVYFVLLLLLVNAILIYYAIVIMMYTLRINKILGRIRNCNHGGNLYVGKSVAYLSIILTVLSCLGFLFSLMALFASAVMSDVIHELGVAVNMDGIMASYTSANMLSGIFSVIRSIGMIILFIMSCVMNGRIKQFSGTSLSSPDRGYYIDNSITQNNAAGNEPETVQLYMEPQIQDDISKTSYGNPADTGIFEGKIISLSGIDKGISYPVRNGEEIIIGKDPNASNIVIDKKYGKISRRHCGIKYNASDDIYQVIDYSTNGTYINSVRKLSRGVYVSVPKGTIINLANENLDYKLI